MFIRWQHYTSRALNPWQRNRNAEGTRLRAVLVEAVRIDGKPRQRHIAFLGSIRIDQSDRLPFWHNVATAGDFD